MTRPPAYLARILAAAAVGAFRPGAVHAVGVLHDADCRRPEGGPCTCAPDISIAELGADGRPCGGPTAS